MIYYLISMSLSLFSLIMTIIITFTENVEETNLRFFGDTELTVFLVVSVIMMIIGIITEDRKLKEELANI